VAVVDPDVLTPVSPMGFSQFRDPTYFKRYANVNAEAKRMPVRVEKPRNGLDLVLRCLPSMAVTHLLVGTKVGGNQHVTGFHKGHCMPREVGGLQDTFNDAVNFVFGDDAVKISTKKTGGTPDVAVKVFDSPCAVEMLLDKLEEHHARWRDNICYSPCLMMNT
jgi:hypothetical protein